MYEKVVPYKNFKGEPKNKKVQLDLMVPEFFKLFPEFHRILSWRDQLMAEDQLRELNPDEVRDFYTDLEEVLVAAWGVMSEDGEYFRKAGVYDFKESKLFEATMIMFLSDVEEANKMIDALMPKGMEDLVRKFEGNLDAAAADPSTPPDIRAQIAALQAQLPPEELEASKS